MLRCQTTCLDITMLHHNTTTRFERVTGTAQKASNVQHLSACKVPTCNWIVKGFMVCKGHGPQELPLVSLKPRCLQIQLPCIHAESVLTVCSDRPAEAVVGVLSHLWQDQLAHQEHCLLIRLLLPLSTPSPGMHLHPVQTMFLGALSAIA